MEEGEWLLKRSQSLVSSSLCSRPKAPEQQTAERQLGAEVANSSPGNTNPDEVTMCGS